MNYLNLHTDTLRSAEYLGADPIERATWLNLMGWCASQENGGIITGASSWTDRKWQQLCGITKAEVEIISELYHFDTDGNLHVRFYPSDKESEVRIKRETARTNGRKGGRPPRESQGTTNVGSHNKPTLVSPEKAEGNEKEGNEKEGRESTRETPDDFTENARKIVEAYPRREKILAAMNIVAGHLREGDDFEAILSGTKAAAAVIRTLPSGASNRYVPSAVAFFEGKRWADDPETLRRQGDTKSGSMPLSDDEFVAQLGGRARKLQTNTQ